MSGQAALRVARRLVDERGTEVPAHPELVAVKLSVRAMGAVVGLSPSTVQKYLGELEELGVLVDKANRWFDRAKVHEVELPPRLDLSPPLSVPGTTSAELGRAFEALLDLVEAAPSELPGAIATAEYWLRTAASGARLDRTGRAAGEREDARRAVRPARNHELNEMDEKQPSSASSSSVGARSLRDAHTTPLTDQDPVSAKHAAVAELDDAARRLAVQRVTNWEMLLGRLENYTVDQVRFAVAKLLREVDAGLLKPIGKLGNLASSGDVNYFPATPPPVHLPGEESAEIVERNAKWEPLPAPDRQVGRAGLASARSRLGRI